jgi:hypothetical protein
MKSKLLVALLLSVGILGTASAANKYGVATEMGFESGKELYSDSRTVSIAPYYRFDSGIKLDIKLEGTRNTGHTVTGNNQDIRNSVEFRAQHDYSITSGLTGSVRVGLGEKLNYSDKNGKLVDYSFYTVEPILVYSTSPVVSFNTSYKFSNSLAADSYSDKTNTFKLGAGYKLTPTNEIGVKYFEKFGDVRSNGLEFVYALDF